MMPPQRACGAEKQAENKSSNGPRRVRGTDAGASQYAATQGLRKGPGICWYPALSCTGFPFEKALGKRGISFVCECKKASPSKGIIAEEFPYLDIACAYEQAGADCISVLTEPKWFLGENRYLAEIAQAVPIPCLRKDFIVDEYMIYEARTLGAAGA